MGKVKRKIHSIKWALLLYLPICLIAAIAGAFAIGFATNDMQEWYHHKHSDEALVKAPYYEVHLNEDGKEYVYYTDQSGADITSKVIMHSNIFFIISNAQLVIIPTWVFFCIIMAGVLFYNRELKKPIDILLEASKKITDNQLDFKVEYKKHNELGMLCSAFDEMRSALYENNRKLWRSLEERKRLNSAFSHDLRTPLTVLKGYSEYLEKYAPDGKVPQEKLLSVVSMMNGQISRLEHYTQKMNSIQKLEDIVPVSSPVSADEMLAMLAETGRLICGDKFSMNASSISGTVLVDTEIVMQVYENLISNAARYAKNSARTECRISDNILEISVLDDGRGFSAEALKKAAQPFFRDDKEADKLHFGLGLYICRILCEKCGGALTVENCKSGGKVTATFFCGEISESR